jgi:hypothetical protein
MIFFAHTTQLNLFHSLSSQMIILEFHNRIVEETVKAQVLSGGADVVDVTCADFDGVSFHGKSKDKKNSLYVYNFF